MADLFTVKMKNFIEMEQGWLRQFKRPFAPETLKAQQPVIYPGSFYFCRVR
jgi:hypothetical protein